MQQPKLSIIIPTVNASDELDLALTSLEENSTLPHELIVVVDPDQKTGKVSGEILKVINKHGLTAHVNKENLGPYGNWNRGAKLASYDFFVFATDDQYFAKNWDQELVNVWKPKRLVAGRLVEPGIIPVWRTNIKHDFGILPSEFDKAGFDTWCEQNKQKGYVKDGFFIPLLMSRKDYLALGGYNTAGKFGTSSAVSNDDAFIKNALSKGYQFGTSSSSFSYHFQGSSWKKKTLNPKIAAVVLTKNEQESIQKCLDSLKFVNDIFVIDSGSTDKTLDIAKKYNCTIVKHDFDNFAAQRNFALTYVEGYDWVFMLDADEVVEDELKTELLSFAKDIYLDGVHIPRKNYIFGRFIEHSDWYPDYRLVFFRPKLIKFEGDVHERAVFTRGNGSTANSSGHIIHDNYQTVAEFVDKNLVSYPKHYAASLHKSGVKYTSSDVVSKGIGEFFRRFFLVEGWKDGAYGFALSFMMGVQTSLAYIYLWEIEGKKDNISSEEVKNIFSSLSRLSGELKYWLTTIAIETSQGLDKFSNRVKRKTIKIISHL